MKHLFMSDILGKTFDSEEECIKAEKEHEAKLLVEEDAKKKVSKEISAQKKLLADNIAKADEELTKALEAYEVSKNDVKDLYDEARDEINDIISEVKAEAEEILAPTRSAVKDAQKAKLDAVSAFNKKFGAYEVKYTGEKAMNEYHRITNYVNSYFNSLVDSFFSNWF